MKIFSSLSRVMSYIATGLLLPMMTLTVVDVFMRYALNDPITGTSELTKLMMVGLALGMSWTAIQGRHISVDVVMKRFSPRVQAAVGSITTLIGLTAIVAVTWQSYLTSVNVVLKHKYVASQILPVPMFPFHWLFVLGCLLLCLSLVLFMIQQVKGAVKG